MSAWLKRFSLHVAAAIGATGIFVAAAAVGANQTRQNAAVIALVQVTSSPTPRLGRKPTVEVAATQAPAASTSAPGASTSSTAQTPLGSPTQTQPGATPALANATPVSPRSTQAEPGSTDQLPDQADLPPDQADPAPGAVQAQPGAPPKPAARTQPTPKPSPVPRRTPLPTTAPAGTPTTSTSAAAAPTTEKVVPERSLAGTIQDILPDGLDVLGVGGREWRVTPAPGALIRLNGKTVRLDALRVGDTVVILGQAQPKEGSLFPFLSHAITARRK